VVAVKTLGCIVSSCGNVMGPYLEYPQLLSVLLRMLHEGHAMQRREVIKVRKRAWHALLCPTTPRLVGNLRYRNRSWHGQPALPGPPYRIATLCTTVRRMVKALSGRESARGTCCLASPVSPVSRIRGALTLFPGACLRVAPGAQVLGIIGALDPHTHKVNQASLSGEGKLEKEGVRPLRQGAAAAAAAGGAGLAGDSGDSGLGEGRAWAGRRDGRSLARTASQSSLVHVGQRFRLPAPLCSTQLWSRT
jgi:hypothetical protein